MKKTTFTDADVEKFTDEQMSVLERHAKRCTQCGVWKLKTEFYAKTSTHLRSECKRCTKRYNNRHYRDKKCLGYGRYAAVLSSKMVADVMAPHIAKGLGQIKGK